MANRKLQGEIERVLKKVDEGVQVFEQIWDKVYSAATTAQKEKYEGDLKKEIKKLQRLRDQIKTWQGDSSIKDKTKLDLNRKLIEEKMEKFKICEKETKTKAFSKEGLAQDRTDPRQKAKAEINEWVKEAITKLREQSDELEAEIESLNSGKRKKRAEENPRVAELKEHIGRHEHHVLMLERVLRAVYNDAVAPDEALELRESVEYYIESNQEPDFYEDDEMYDTLNLDSVPTPAPATRKSAKTTKDDDEDHHTPTSSERGSARKGSTAANSPKAHTSGSKSRTSGNNHRGSSSNTAGRTISPKTDSKSAASSGQHSPAHGHNGSASRDVSSPRVFPGGPLMSSVVKTGSAAAAAKQASEPAQDPTVRKIFQPNPAAAEPPTAAPVPSAHVTQKRWNGVVSAAVRDSGPASSGRTTRANVSSTFGAAVPSAGSSSGPHESSRRTPAIGASEVSAQLSAIERAFGIMPENAAPLTASSTPNVAAGGSSVNQALSPRNPANTPPSFPHVTAAVFENPNIFLKFDPDTLFFIFYYQQGTYQQYLAAKELKRQGWRFHKKYLTWFQRHDEPKVCNDEYETGTFIYFDYANVVFQGQGTGWCQRIKSEFVFEYRYLEDEMV